MLTVFLFLMSLATIVLSFYYRLTLGSAGIFALLSIPASLYVMVILYHKLSSVQRALTR